MLSFFRRVSKSKIGTWIMVAVLVAILGGFAASDISNFGSGNIGFGMGSSTLAKVGNQQVSERDMSDAMQRRLQEVRDQKPEADYATIIGDFDQVLGRLIDAEIAQIPQTKGLNGQFSDQAYQAFLQRQRLTDAQVRDIIGSGMLQRLLLTP